VDFFVHQLDRDVHLLGHDVLADIDGAELDLSLLDVQPLLDHGDADLALDVGGIRGGVGDAGPVEVAGAGLADLQAVVLNAVERGDRDALAADVGIIPIDAIDGPILSVIGADDVQPLAKLQLLSHDLSSSRRARWASRPRASAA